MTTWAQAIRHPWYDPAPPKRKISNADDERRPSPYQRSSPSPTSRAKRRKFNTLEHGFAHLTLASAPTQNDSASGLVITPIHPTASSTTFPPCNVVLPSSVEEPPHEIEAVAPEVNMEDLDEEEYTDKMKLHDTAPHFSISTPLLQRLRKHQTVRQPIIPISSPSTEAGALVLYRPLRPISPTRKVDEQAESVEEIIVSSFERDDDAMDIE
ncbi:hypothetical protein DEU56DRAFT_778576 [Suillus clintonianus]|uniref:uncharacterized protein n=1 Tax=Suillus clintonianus TaxID=1904413 RepID=UPI001B8758EB|nr:uncharacterized protein DEU56DRAFT_778576 [Suillus clintonianus]KAG2150801.1 hypothetical protein DEU56DRAFT_778576 [Suillus clintonianus]